MLHKKRAFICLLAVLAVSPSSSFAQRVRLSPRLRAGQTLIYQLDFTASRLTKTESHVTVTQVPPSSDVQASCLLQVYVQEVNGSTFHLRTAISDRPVAVASGLPTSNRAQDAGPDRTVEVQIAADGTSGIKGFDQLSVAQQLAWSAWLAGFTSPLTFLRAGISPGEKWQLSEPETASSPIAKLVWLKKYQYVRDEPCIPGSPASSERCAVVLVLAHIRQDSSPERATPEDFKLRGLATRGRASGTNETILYISKTTGLLFRSTEAAQQSMDVNIALADGSNSVHYSISANSRSQVQLVPETPTDAR